LNNEGKHILATYSADWFYKICSTPSGEHWRRLPLKQW